MWIRVSMLPAASNLSPTTASTAACVQGQLCGLDLGCQQHSCRRKHLARSLAAVPCFAQELLFIPVVPLGACKSHCCTLPSPLLMLPLPAGFLSLHLFALGLAGLWAAQVLSPDLLRSSGTSGLHPWLAGILPGGYPILPQVCSPLSLCPDAKPKQPLQKVTNNLGNSSTPALLFFFLSTRKTNALGSREDYLLCWS